MKVKLKNNFHKVQSIFSIKYNSIKLINHLPIRNVLPPIKMANLTKNCINKNQTF